MILIWFNGEWNAQKIKYEFHLANTTARGVFNKSNLFSTIGFSVSLAGIID